MKITATRRLQYAIGHRVFKHESKCAHLHGHNFVFHLTAEACVLAFEPDPDAERLTRLVASSQLDSLGRVIDFGVLKAKFDPWFSLNWDHGMVLFDQDEEAIAALRQLGGKRFLLPYNPTAENLARYILEVVGPSLLDGTGVRLVKVTVDETENGRAEASL